MEMKICVTSDNCDYLLEIIHTNFIQFIYWLENQAVSNEQNQLLCSHSSGDFDDELEVTSQPSNSIGSKLYILWSFDSKRKWFKICSLPDTNFNWPAESYPLTSSKQP